MNLLNAFMKDWRTTGSVVPSSRFLQEEMMTRLPFDRIRVAVELGPGTGCITQAILNRLAPDAKLLAVDINEEFVVRLSEQFSDPRLIPLQASATDLLELLQSQGMNSADCVVSGLPFANLSPQLRHQIVRASLQALAPGGTFVAFQYAPFALPPVLKRHFSKIRTDFVLLNLPPALVYSCQKPIPGNYSSEPRLIGGWQAKLRRLPWLRRPQT